MKFYVKFTNKDEWTRFREYRTPAKSTDKSELLMATLRDQLEENEELKKAFKPIYMGLIGLHSVVKTPGIFCIDEVTLHFIQDMPGYALSYDEYLERLEYIKTLTAEQISQFEDILRGAPEELNLLIEMGIL